MGPIGPVWGQSLYCGLSWGYIQQSVMLHAADLAGDLPPEPRPRYQTWVYKCNPAWPNIYFSISRRQQVKSGQKTRDDLSVQAPCHIYIHSQRGWFIGFALSGISGVPLRGDIGRVKYDLGEAQERRHKVTARGAAHRLERSHLKGQYTCSLSYLHMLYRWMLSSVPCYQPVQYL